MPFKTFVPFMLLLTSSVSAWTHCFAQSERIAKAVEVSEKEMAKRLDHFEAPKLPDGALVKCSNAMVVLKVTINESGIVTDEEFVSGFNQLKESALTAIKQWTYKPYMKHGEATAVHTSVSIFYLGDGESFPVYVPDGKGGVRGGNVIPLPPGCGAEPIIKRTPN